MPMHCINPNVSLVPRNIENGGSLSIIATALTETGSKMDEVISKIRRNWKHGTTVDGKSPTAVFSLQLTGRLWHTCDDCCWTKKPYNGCG